MFKMIAATATAVGLTIAPASAVTYELPLDSWYSTLLFVNGTLDPDFYHIDVPVASILTLIDQGEPTDVWGVRGDLTGVTSFYTGAPGTPGAAYQPIKWASPAHSKLTLAVAPGEYTFSVYGITIIPNQIAGVDVGLHAAPVTAPVPEPATWAMMIAGFGAIGMAFRRGRKQRLQVSFARA